MLYVYSYVLATCLDQLTNLACSDNATCYTCGDRIAYLEDQVVMKRAAAEQQVATEFPTECGECAGRVVKPVVSAACNAALGTQACSNGACYSCGSRMQYLYTTVGYSLDAALLEIAREFPVECGACRPAPVKPHPSSVSVENPVRFEYFMRSNLAPSGNMPLSYREVPSTYFDTLPTYLKTLSATGNTSVSVCAGSATGGIATADMVNAYTFQTERYLTTLGLDVYDGAVWSIAMGVLGNEVLVRRYTRTVLETGTTAGLQSIRSDVPCKGQDCDPYKESCGVCYGDNYATLSGESAMEIRLITDTYAAPGSVDARCPDLKLTWKWNDYKPILGENAWSLFLGPLTTAIQRYGSAAAIPETSKDFLLAVNFLPGLATLGVNVSEGQPGYGAYYYTAHNIFIYEGANPHAGSQVSIENQASLLAGLKGLSYVLGEMQCKDLDCHAIRCDVESRINAMQSFLLSAYNGEYFRTTGKYNATTREWAWLDTPFAADCQTWVGTVLGPQLIDEVHGKNTTARLWESIKEKAGFRRYENGTVRGVGYDGITDPVYYANSTTIASPTVKLRLTILSSFFSPSTYMPKLTAVFDNNTLGIRHEVVTQQREADGTESVSIVFVAQEGESDYQTVFDYCQAAVYDLNTPNNADRIALSVSRAYYSEVFSAEWTFGTINFARIIAAESGYTEAVIDDILWDSDFMRSSLEEELLATFTISNTITNAFSYANSRYYVPFGWWANNIPSAASTGWGVLIDMGWNPLHVLGTVSSSYPAPPHLCATPAPPATNAPLAYSVKHIVLSISMVDLAKVVSSVSEMQDTVSQLLNAKTNDCVNICLMAFISNVWVSQQCYSCSGAALRREGSVESVPERYDVSLEVNTKMSYADAEYTLTIHGNTIVHPTRGSFDGVTVTVPTPVPPDTSVPSTDVPPTSVPGGGTTTKAPHGSLSSRTLPGALISFLCIIFTLLL